MGTNQNPIFMIMLFRERVWTDYNVVFTRVEYILTQSKFTE